MLQALSYILEDEKLEVTPKRIVMRKDGSRNQEEEGQGAGILQKAILDANERRIAAKARPLLFAVASSQSKQRSSHDLALNPSRCGCRRPRSERVDFDVLNLPTRRILKAGTEHLSDKDLEFCYQCFSQGFRGACYKTAAQTDPSWILDLSQNRC